MSSIPFRADRVGAAIIVGAATLLGTVGIGGCAASARLDRVLRVDPAHASTLVIVGGEEAASLVSVFRDGRPLAARPPFTLQPGDELETGAGVAVIQFPDGGSAVVDERSRVRVGSLEVLFGRVFAAVRGLFSVESETVVAGVEGTEFLFVVGPDRGVHVVVLEGVVVCTSKAGRWDPIRLRSGLGFSTRPPGLEAPRVQSVSPSDLDGIRAWVRRVTGAKVGFASPAPPGYGWCCDAGRVSSSTRAQCDGSFHADRSSAQRACTPAEPTGWCCDAGRLTSGTRSQCRGKFYDDRASAEKACTPAEPTGWCCDAGRVTSGTRSRCRGKFYDDRASAEKACARTKLGWCCLPSYQVQQMTASNCAARKGTFYTDQKTASAACPIIE
jgi:hypothetical protein